MRLQPITRQINQPMDNSKSKNVSFEKHFELLVPKPNKMLAKYLLKNEERTLSLIDDIRTIVCRVFQDEAILQNVSHVSQEFSPKLNRGSIKMNMRYLSKRPNIGTYQVSPKSNRPISFYHGDYLAVECQVNSKNKSSIHILTDTDLTDFLEKLNSGEDVSSILNSVNEKNSFKVRNATQALTVLKTKIFPRLKLDFKYKEEQVLSTLKTWLKEINEKKSWRYLPEFERQ